MRPGAPAAKLWPLAAAIALLGLVLALLFACSLRANDGHLVYALDDAYIHLALARTLAEHGDWGFGAGDFRSASSSPLWVLALAAAICSSARGRGCPSRSTS